MREAMKGFGAGACRPLCGMQASGMPETARSAHGRDYAGFPGRQPNVSYCEAIRKRVVRERSDT